MPAFNLLYVPEVIAEVGERAKNFSRVIVFLESDDTDDRKLVEPEAYAPFVSHGSHCILHDALIDDMRAGFCADRPWDKEDNPKTARRKYIASHKDFAIDKSIEASC